MRTVFSSFTQMCQERDGLHCFSKTLKERKRIESSWKMSLCDFSIQRQSLSTNHFVCQYPVDILFVHKREPIQACHLVWLEFEAGKKKQKSRINNYNPWKTIWHSQTFSNLCMLKIKNAQTKKKQTQYFFWHIKFDQLENLDHLWFE